MKKEGREKGARERILGVTTKKKGHLRDGMET